MEQIIVIRYSELHLKGDNRGFFERLLQADINQKLKGCDAAVSSVRGRYIVSGFNPADTDMIVSKLCAVFGVHSVSTAYKCHATEDSIKECALTLMREIKGSFKVCTNRADKSFPLTSTQTSAMLGQFLLESNPDLCVDLHHPQTVLSVDIREEGFAFVFCGERAGLGGMPTGSAGRGLLLLSGGIDSPVAGFMMAKRGMNLVGLHFHSYPYTNENARQKVYELAERLAVYTNNITLINVRLTEIQEEIRRHCDADYSVILLRMIMMRIATIVARQNRCKCIINGESLGQVASQTIESINVTNSFADIPIFRPLIGMDKQEIIDRARDIGTYQISIRPFEDCCTIFLPKHPVTKPNPHKALAELDRIPNLDGLIKSAFDLRETQLLGCGKA